MSMRYVKNDKRDKRGFVWEKMLYFHSSFCNDHVREIHTCLHQRRKKSIVSTYINNIILNYYSKLISLFHTKNILF